MKLSEEQLQKLFEDIQPSMVESIKADMVSTIKNQIEWEAKERIKDYAGEWINEHIIPEVEKVLIESKDGIVSLGVKMAEDTVGLLAKGITEDLEKRLSESWSRSRIIKAIFEV